MSRRKKPFPFFLWHRRLGLVIFLLVVILSITGILLNHTESLKLDEKTVTSEFILNWYGINPEGKPVNFNNGEIWVSQWNQQIFFNGNSLYTSNEKLQGISSTSDVIVVALESSVLLLGYDGEIIESMNVNTSAPLQKIGSSGNKITLLDNNHNVYISDSQITHWSQQNDLEKQQLNTQWATAEPLTDAAKLTLKQAYRGEGLNLERVILDLHSGRIFNNNWGIYIMDASAIIMILLGISGIWVWWSRRLKMRSKKHYQKHHL